MATVSKSWTWDSDLESFSASATGLGVYGAQHDASNGDPSAGSLQAYARGRKDEVTGTFELSGGTWTSIFGVPAGATVTHVQVTAVRTYYGLTDNTVPDTFGTITVYIDNGSGTFVHAGTLYQRSTSTSADSSWQSASGTQQSVQSSYQSPSQTVHPHIIIAAVAGNNSNAAVSGHLDTLTIEVTYTPPPITFSVDAIIKKTVDTKTIGATWLTASSVTMGNATQERRAQSFTGISGDLKSILYEAGRWNSPSDSLRVQLMGDNAGEPDESVIATLHTVLGSTLVQTSTDPVSGSFTDQPVHNGTTYWLVWSRTGSQDATNYYLVGDSNDDYTDGNRAYYESAAWVDDAANDLHFELEVSLGFGVSAIITRPRVLVCGAECATTPYEGNTTSGDDEHKHWAGYSAANGTVGRSSSVVRQGGAYSWYLTSGNTDDQLNFRIQRNTTEDGGVSWVQYAHFAIRVPQAWTLATGEPLLCWSGDSDSTFFPGIEYDTAGDGAIILSVAGDTNKTLISNPAVDTWYEIEILFDFGRDGTSDSVFKARARVENGTWGAIQTSTRSGDGSVLPVSGIWWGIGGGGGSGAANWTTYYTDIVAAWGQDAYDLWNSGPHEFRVSGLRPNADGAHGFNSATDFNKGGNTFNPTDTDGYTEIDDENSLLNSTEYIDALSTVTDGEYAEFHLENTPQYYDDPAFACIVAASAGGDTAQIILSDGSNTYDAMPALTVPTGSPFVTDQTADVAPDGGAWTKAKVDALRMRLVGYSANGGTTYRGAIVEVAYETWQPAGSFTADAAIAGVGGGAGSFTADAIASTTGTGSLTVDVWIQPTFTVDAFVLSPGAGAFAADAIIKRTQTERVLGYDHYDRTTSPGLGTSDSGHDYTNDDWATDPWTTDGSDAYAYLDAGQGYTHTGMVWNTPALWNMRGRYLFSTPEELDGAADSFYANPQARAKADGTSYYGAQYEFKDDVGQTIDVRIGQKVDGAWTYPRGWEGAIGTTWDSPFADTKWWMECEVIGAGGYAAVAVRLWKFGTARPTAPDTTIMHGDPSDWPGMPWGAGSGGYWFGTISNSAGEVKVHYAEVTEPFVFAVNALITGFNVDAYIVGDTSGSFTADAGLLASQSASFTLDAIRLATISPSAAPDISELWTSSLFSNNETKVETLTIPAWATAIIVAWAGLKGQSFPEVAQQVDLGGESFTKYGDIDSGGVRVALYELLDITGRNDDDLTVQGGQFTPGFAQCWALGSGTITRIDDAKAGGPGKTVTLDGTGTAVGNHALDTGNDSWGASKAPSDLVIDANLLGNSRRARFTHHADMSGSTTYGFPDATNSSAMTAGLYEGPGGLGADAVITSTEAGSLSVDAFIQPFFTVDAYVSAVQTASFTADAAIEAPVSGTFTADAIIKKTIESTAPPWGVEYLGSTSYGTIGSKTWSPTTPTFDPKWVLIAFVGNDTLPWDDPDNWAGVKYGTKDVPNYHYVEIENNTRVGMFWYAGDDIPTGAQDVTFTNKWNLWIGVAMWAGSSPASVSASATDGVAGPSTGWNRVTIDSGTDETYAFTVVGTTLELPNTLGAGSEEDGNLAWNNGNDAMHNLRETSLTSGSRWRGLDGSGQFSSFNAASMALLPEGTAIVVDAVIEAPVAASLTADATISKTQPGALSADALLLRTQTGSISADAVIETGQTGALTADAWLAGEAAGAFSADALVLAVQAAAFSVDAVVTRTGAGAFTAEATVLAVETGQFSADAVVQRLQSGSLSLDAVLTRQVVDVVSADAVLARQQLGSLTVDAWLEQTVTGSITADAIFAKTSAASFTAFAFVEGSGVAAFSADATILVVASGSLTADAVVILWGPWSETWENSVGQVTGAFTTDALIAVEGTGSFAADATFLTTEVAQFYGDAVLRVAVAGDVAVDAVIARTAVGALLVDAVVGRTQAGQHSVDAVLGALVEGQFDVEAIVLRPYTSDFTNDAVVLAANLGSFTAEAAVLRVTTGQYALDAVLFETLVGSLSADAVIARTQSGFLLADAWIEYYLTGSYFVDAALHRTTTGTFTASAFVEGAGVAAFSIDAAIAAVIVGELEAQAAILAEVTDDLRVDAAVLDVQVGQFALEAAVLAEVNDDLAADAILQRTTEQSFGLFAVLEEHLEGAFTGSAVLHAVVAGGFTAEAVLGREAVGSLSADALIGITQVGALSADAWLQQTIAGSLSTDAVLLRQQTGAVAAQSWIAGSGVAAFAGDAVIRASISGSSTADAVVARTQTGSTTADALLLASFAGALSVDALVERLYEGATQADATILATGVGAFAADAVLYGTVEGSLSARAIIRVEEVASFTVEAVILEQRVASLTADAEIVLGTQEASFSASAVVEATNTGTFLAEAYVYGLGVAAFTVDAVLHVQRDATFSLDALLQSTVEGQFQNWAIVEAGLESSLTAEATVRRVQSEVLLLEAVKAAASSDVFGVWAVLLAQQDDAFQAAAWVKGAGVGAFAADAVVRGTQVDSFASSAWLQTTNAGSFGAYAFVAITSSDTIAVDAVLLGTVVAGVPASAVLNRITVASFTADAAVGETRTGGFVADALIVSSAVTTFTVDATVTSPTSGTFFVDASISRVITGKIEATFSAATIAATTSAATIDWTSSTGTISWTGAAAIEMTPGAATIAWTPTSYHTREFSVDAVLT